jgi:hypothetical protein
VHWPELVVVIAGDVYDSGFVRGRLGMNAAVDTCVQKKGNAACPLVLRLLICNFLGVSPYSPTTGVPSSSSFEVRSKEPLKRVCY